MDVVWFDEEDDAAELVAALEAEGYRTRMRREGFAGEDDSDDRAWALHVTPFDEGVETLVEVYGGWVSDADAPAVAPLDLPDGPRTLKDR